MHMCVYRTYHFVILLVYSGQSLLGSSELSWQMFLEDTLGEADLALLL